jgi:hypothetical protein
MRINEARKNFIFTTRIDLPSEDGENDFIVLREPTLQEMQKFGDDEKKNIETLEKIFPGCLVEHSFINDDESPAKNEDVYNLLKDSSSLFTEIIDSWFKNLPFHSRLQKEQK